MPESPQYRPEGRRRRLAPVVSDGRNAVREALAGAGIEVGSLSKPQPLVLVACSGGPDSLALAAVTAFYARRGSIRAGAVIVDHNLQPGSAAVAASTAKVLTALGLDPVSVVAVAVQRDGQGPEAAARTARYGAFEDAAGQCGAEVVLLGHTLDDQAESVLLGLARGSGTRSLAGIPARRGRYLRPFLGLRREDTEAICAAEDLHPWHDPSNADPAYTRSRVRTTVLPFLEEHLGPGIAEALSRSARILGEDAAYLDGRSTDLFAQLAERKPEGVHLPIQTLSELPAAMRHRVIAQAAVELGADHPSLERVLAVERLLMRRGSAGPVQLAGKVQAFRETSVRSVPAQERGYGRLIFKNAH